MKTVSKIALLSLLLFVNTATAFANSNDRQDRRESKNSELQVQQSERKRVKNAAFNPNDNADVAPENQQRQAGNNMKNGRMSQEEKRALRRQINEVGRDIYLPAR
jgi:hypothetical protein